MGEHIVDHLQDGNDDQLLSEWQQASPDNKTDLKKYRKIWTGTDSATQINRFDTAKAWNNVDSNIESRQLRLRRLKNLAYTVSGMAASLLIFLALTFYTGLFSSPESQIALSTTYGSRSEVTLPDGSLVQLNAGSNLEYHFDKLSKTRSVDFSGEAFFEVAKSKQPFIITTPDGLKVKVLGTKFNLSAYPEDRSVQTTLVEGKVELSTNQNTVLVLNPGQIASFQKQSNQLDYVQGEVAHQLGWTQNKLYMDNMSLQDVCIRLERWYDVDITLSEKSLGEKIHYTGVLREQTVSDVLNALCRLSSISYEMKGKDIQISGQ
jgi:ferric-dicitrate binding protein FerR (iron transport regulator)